MPHDSLAERVSLTLDTAHLAKSGVTDIAGILADYAEFVDNIHLKDLRNGEFRLLGQGDIEFTPFFDTLRPCAMSGLCASTRKAARAWKTDFRSHTVTWPASCEAGSGLEPGRRQPGQGVPVMRW